MNTVAIPQVLESTRFPLRGRLRRSLALGSHVHSGGTLVEHLRRIVDGCAPEAVKRQSIKWAVRAYLNGSDYIKHPQALSAALTEACTEQFRERLYDNVVARSLAGRTHSALYRAVMRQLRMEIYLDQVAESPGLRKRDIAIEMPGWLLPYLP